MSDQPRHRLSRRVLVGALAVAVPGISVLLAAPAVPQPAFVEDAVAVVHDDGTPVPADVERVVAGDMVVDWVGGAPDGAAEALHSSGVPAELTVDDSHEDTEDAPQSMHAAAHDEHDDAATEHHEAGRGGYALFSTTARWLPGGYTLRLTGADGRIEQYRSDLVQAARVATEATGVPVRVAKDFGGPVSPGRGEIAVVLGSGPCGATAVGCGGPTLTSRELVSGRVWVHPSALGLTAVKRSNLAAHELGHALGLQHFDASWTDGRQVMYPTITGTNSFRAGDGAGLRHAAGTHDPKAGTVTSRRYAAGSVHVAGTVASGTRIRLTSGSVTNDVVASGGRFSGAIPLPAGTHVVCASSLDAAPGFRKAMGCGSVEAPGRPVAHGDGVVGSFETIRLTGWAVDPQTAAPVNLQIRRNGVLVATIAADQDRGDLGERAHHYGTKHGFDAQIPAEAGRNRVCVRIIGVGGGGHLDAGCAEVVHDVDPVGALEVVRTEGLGVSVSGWALDPNSPDPVSVSVSVDGEVTPVAGTTNASQDRPDVARRHPAHGPAHGFTHRMPLLPGRHEVCVTVINVGLGRDRSLGCTDVVVEDAASSPAVTVTSTVDHVLDAATSPEQLVGDLTTTLVRP